MAVEVWVTIKQSTIREAWKRYAPIVEDIIGQDVATPERIYNFLLEIPGTQECDVKNLSV